MNHEFPHRKMFQSHMGSSFSPTLLLMIQALGHDLFVKMLYTLTMLLIPFSQYFVLYADIPSFRGLLCSQLTTDKEDPVCSTFYFT
jgi:hypothetical protein